MNEIVYRGESNQPLTNSKLVAEVFEKPHDNVLKAIRKILQGGIVKNDETPMFEETTYINEQNKQSYPMFIMNQDGFTLLAMGFNGKKAMEFKLKYIEAFNAMKRQIEESNPSVPQNYLEALKSLVKAEEEKQQLALENKKQQEQILTISKTNMELGNKITEMLPKVSYYDKILQSNATMTVTQIAQDYGMTAMRLNKELESMRIQHKVRGQWILFAQFLEGGYVHSRAVEIVRSDGRHDVKYNTEWTTKGRIFLYESLKAKGILPLIEQENTPSIRALVEQSQPRQLVTVNKPSNSTDMIDPEIKEQLDRIEQYSLIAAKNVLNINEAAIILGMTVRGVRENVRNRIIPCYKPNVNRLYFKKSELEEWMTQNRRKSMAELKSEAAAYCFTH